jgi:hypothetical protein
MVRGFLWGIEEGREQVGGFFKGARVDSECKEGLLIIRGFYEAY